MDNDADERVLDFTLVGYTPTEGDVVFIEFPDNVAQDEAVKIHAKLDPKLAPAKVVILAGGARVARPQ